MLKMSFPGFCHINARLKFIAASRGEPEGDICAWACIYGKEGAEKESGMVRQRVLIGVLLFGLFGVCACGRIEEREQEIIETEEPAPMEESVLAGESKRRVGTEEMTQANRSTSETESIGVSIGEETKTYYGSWHIYSCVGASPIYALSPEEIGGFLGKTLTYGSTSYSWEGALVEIPGYAEEIQTTDAIEKELQISFVDLGYQAEEGEVLAVSVLEQSGQFGAQLYVISDTTLLIYYEGVFFEAVRV